MLCGVCQQNEATVHLTKVVENKMQNVELCEHCAKITSGDDPAFYLMDLLDSVKPMPIRIR